MVREAKLNDLESIVDIHNQAIEARFQTCFTEKSISAEKLPWLQGHLGGPYPMFVYEQVGHVAGYLSISDYRQGRGALRYAVEVSYFIHRDYHRMGIGTLLLGQGIASCRELGYKTMLAILLEGNIASIKLLNKFGFKQWGYLPDIADFDGITCGQLYYGLKL